MPISDDVDIAAVLDVIRHNAAYLRSATYEQLVSTWSDDVLLLPSEQEILDGWAVVLTSRKAEQDELDIHINAKSQLAAVPDWSTWSEQTALAWFDASVSTADDMLPVLRDMIRMVIGLRNSIEPGLQE